MWHLWSPSKLIMPKKLNVAAGSSGILKRYHIIRDVYYSLPMCSTLEKTLCPFHYLDIKANSFWSTGIFPFWPVVFRDHDFALNHKDIESTLQFNKNRHTYLLRQLTTPRPDFWSLIPSDHNFLQMFCLLGDQISALIVHWESVWENCWVEL
jgi:hypothetical protein